MTLLDAVNLALKAMGESRVREIDPDHPQHEDILAQIETTSLVVQSRGWWFNQRQVTLLPSQTPGPNIGKVEVPPFAELVNPVAHRDRYVQPQAGVLVDTETGLEVTWPILVGLRFAYPNLQWDLIPSTVQTYIAHRAALEFTADFDADQLKLQTLQSRTASAYAMANADNIRYAKMNFFQQGTTGRAIARHWGQKVRV